MARDSGSSKVSETVVREFRTSPWADFLDARMRLIHEWHREGCGVEFKPMTAAEIAKELNHHDETQIRLLLATPPEPVPGSLRDKLRGLIRYLNDA
jgi:hypothetical protein